METAVDTYSVIGVAAPNAIAFASWNSCDALGMYQGQSSSFIPFQSGQVRVFDIMRGTATLGQAISSLTGVQLNGFGYSFASILKILKREGHYLLSSTSKEYSAVTYPSSVDLVEFFGEGANTNPANYYRYRVDYAGNGDVNPFFYPHLLKSMITGSAAQDSDSAISNLMQLQLAQGASLNPVNPIAVYEFLCCKHRLGKYDSEDTRVLFGVSKKTNTLEIFVDLYCVRETNVMGKKTPSHFNHLVATQFGISAPYNALQGLVANLTEAELDQAKFIFEDKGFDSQVTTWVFLNENVTDSVKNFYRQARNLLGLIQILCIIRESRADICQNAAVRIGTQLIAAGRPMSDVRKAIKEMELLTWSLSNFISGHTLTKLNSYGVTNQMLTQLGFSFLTTPGPNASTTGSQTIFTLSGGEIPGAGNGVRRVRNNANTEEESLARFMGFIGQKKYGDALAALRDDFARLSLHLGHDSDEWAEHMLHLFSPFFISCESAGPACRDPGSSSKHECPITLEPLQDNVVKFPCGRNPPHLFNIFDPAAAPGRQRRTSGWLGQILGGTSLGAPSGLGRIATWTLCALCRGEFKISDEAIAQLRAQFP